MKASSLIAPTSRNVVPIRTRRYHDLLPNAFRDGVDFMSAIGVRIRDTDLSLGDMRRIATTAEGAGYESAWLPESMGRDAVAELISLVAATERITIGTGIVPVFGRQPTLTAAAVATAAAIAPGRVILGVGIGLSFPKTTSAVEFLVFSTEAG